MKNKQLRSFVLYFFVIFIASCGCKRSKDDIKTCSSPVIFYKDGTLKQDVFELLRVLNVEHDETLKGIVAVTQQQWLRQKGKERWEITERFADKRKKLLPLFEKLQVIQEISPSKMTYDYALILGATLSRVRRRLSFLITLWERGIRFSELVFLCSQRPLDEAIETKDALFDAQNKDLAIRADWQSDQNIPKTEVAMMKMVFDQAALPKEMEDVRVTFIDVPMKKEKDGTVRRPTTPDTIHAWLLDNPEPGTCLGVSSQPHVGYQHAVFRTILPKNFFIETVGPSCNPKDIKIVILLDMMARWLYQEEKRLSSQIRLL